MVMGILLSLSFWVPFIWLWCLGHAINGLCLGIVTMLISFFSLYRLHNTSSHVKGALKKGKVIDLVDHLKGDKDEEKSTD